MSLFRSLARTKNQRLRHVAQRRLLMESLENRDLMATRVWDGGGANTNWTTAANWVGDVAPAAGDDLVFAGSTRTTNINNYTAGTAFNSISFASGASAFSISGNSIALGASIDSSAATVSHSIGTQFTIGGSRTITTSASGINLTGAISGAGSITKLGAGDLGLHGANSFSGGLTLKNGGVAVGTATGAGSGTITLGDTDSNVNNAVFLYTTLANATVNNAFAVPSANGMAHIMGAANGVIYAGSIALADDVTLTGATSISFTGGVTGTGNLLLNNWSTNTITISGSALNNSGTIGNVGGGTGTNLISAPIGGGITHITQNSTTSALNISGKISVNATATTIQNVSGSKALVLSGGTTGTGNLILQNNSALYGGISLTDGVTLNSGMINHVGDVTNSGTGSGHTTFSAPIESNVKVIQNSATSELQLINAKPNFFGGLTVRSGTASGHGSTTAFGIGKIKLGHTSGSANVTLLGGVNGTFANPIDIVAGNTGTATITTSTTTAVFGGVIDLSDDLNVFANFTNAITLAGGVTGTGNIKLLSHDSAAIGMSTVSVNHVGIITNESTGTATHTISAPIGVNVIGITQNSTTSALTTSGAISVNSGGKTFRNVAGTKKLTVGGSISGTGPLTLKNDSALVNGIELTGTVGNSGTITNSGLGTGSTLISGEISHASASVTQESESSSLVLDHANNYRGGTTVNAGVLHLTEFYAISPLETDQPRGPLVVNGPTSVVLMEGSQRTGNVTLRDEAAITGVGYLTATSFVLESGTIDVRIGAPSATKSTPGTVTLSGIVDLTNGIAVDLGTLLIDGQMFDTTSAVDVVVASGATLGGNGTIGGTISVSSGGTLSPGTASGILTSTNIVLTTGSSFNVELGGVTAGSGGSNHDQLRASSAGSVTINSGVALDVSTINGFSPTRGNTFTIIDNQSSSPISGTFDGLLDGAIVVAGSTAYRIDYDGGTGNDIVLTAVADIELASLTTVGSSLTANIEVKYAMVPSYTIKLYASPDGIAEGTLLTTTTVNNSSLLAPGLHAITLNTNFDDPGQDYFLLVKVDADNQVAESSELNNNSLFSGAFIDAKGLLHIHRGAEADGVTITESAGQLLVKLNPNVTPPYWATSLTGLNNLLSVIATNPPYMNQDNPYDTNNDGFITGLDAQGVINYLSSIGTPHNKDVDGDGSITPFDALSIINFLNTRDAGNLSPGTNPNNPWDVNDDGTITSADVTALAAVLPFVQQYSFTASAVAGIRVRSHDGDDAISISSTITKPSSLFGGAGNDSITGGSGSDTIDGGAGDDSVAGGAGDDTLFGSQGNDTLDGGDGKDTLDGGAGDDSLAGGDGNDTLMGSEGDDTLAGGTGDDEYRYVRADIDHGSDTIDEQVNTDRNVVNLAGTASTSLFDFASVDPQDFGFVTITSLRSNVIQFAVPGINGDNGATQFEVPGPTGTTTKVAFTFDRNDAGFLNQLFVDVVGEPDSTTAMFTSNVTTVGTVVYREYLAGTILKFRVKQNGGDPGNTSPRTLHSDESLNDFDEVDPNVVDADQVRIVSIPHGQMMYWEDLLPNSQLNYALPNASRPPSDFDYNDMTYSVKAITVVGVTAPGMTAPVNEAGGSEYFTFTRTGDISQPLEVEYRVLPSSTAIAGTDYERLYPLLQTVGVVSFAANEASVTVAVDVKVDAFIEGLETVDIELVIPESDADYEIDPSSDSAFVVIEDDDTGRNDSKYCPGCNCNIGCAIGNFFEEVGAAIIDVGVAASKLASAAGSFISSSLAEMRNISSSNPHPIVSIDVIVTQTMADADVVEATLAFDTLTPFSVYYSTDNLVVGETVRIAMQPDATLLPTGRYHWELTVTEHTGSSTNDRTYQGDREILNLKDSYYGVRWQPKNVGYLVLGQPGGVLLVEGDGNESWFKGDTTAGFVRTQGENGFSGLIYNSGTSTYTLRSSYGSERDFDANGLLVVERDTIGRETTFAYVDANGDMLAREISTITDHVGRVTTYTYTSNYDTLGNRQIKITDFANRETLVHIDGTTNLVMWVDEPDPDTTDVKPAPRTSFTYDPTTKLLTSVTNADGDSYEFGYDETRTLDSITDSSGAQRDVDSEITSGLVYPSSGLGTLLNPAPLAKAFGIRYDNAGNPTTYTTNNYGQWTSATDALNNTTYFERNAEGWLMKLIQPDPDGAGPVGQLVTSYEYDAKGNRTKQTNPDGSYRSWTYDPSFSQVTSFTDELNHTTLYSIDPANGNLLSERRVVGLVDGVGNSETDDVVTSFTYTPVPTLSTDAPEGLLESVTDAELRTTKFAYNASGLLRFVTYAVGTIDEAFVEYQYDSLDRVEYAFDELRRMTTYQYDQLNRLTRVTYQDPDSSDGVPAPYVDLEYDDSHRLRKVIDPLGRLTEYHYNLLGQLDGVFTPDHDEDGNRTLTEYRYDAYNRLEEIEDARHFVQTLVYDELGRVKETLLPHPSGNPSLPGPSYSQTWGATGWTLTSTDPLTTVTKVNYQMIQEVGERGASEGWEPARFITTTVAAHPVTGVAGAGPQMSEEYDAVGNLVKSTDALGRITVYEYDALDRLVTVTQPDPDLYFDATATPPAWVNGPLTSPVTEYGYDKVGNLKTIIDPNEGVMTYNYDFRDRLTSVVEPNPLTGAATGGPATHYTYYDTGEVKTMLDAENGLTNYYYDDLGRLEIVDLPDPDGSDPLPRPKLIYEYDNADQLKFTTLTDSTATIFQVTGYDYDDHGNLETITEADPDGAGPLLSPVWSYTYDDLGNLLTETDPLERQTVYTYDALGRQETLSYRDEFGVEPSNAPRWTYAYDLAGNLKTATDRLTHATTYDYDKLHRLTTVTDALSHSTTYEYDAVGNVVLAKDAEDRRHAYRYDSLDRLSQEFYVDGSGDELSNSPRTTYAYDAIGNLKSTKDRLDHVTGYDYDYLNRLTTETDANLAETSYTYDAVGNLKTLTDPEQNTTAWLYDKLDRVTEETNELNKTRFYHYDSASNLVEKVDRNGRKTTYEYDDLNRNTAERWVDGSSAVIRTLSFAYDAAGQLTDAADPTAAYHYDYDAVGRLDGETQDIAGLMPQIALGRSYDAANRLSSVTASIGSTADFRNDYQYDQANRLTRITQQGQSGGSTVAAKRIDLTYNDANQWDTITRYADVAGTDLVATTTYGYDPGIGRLTSLDHAKGVTSLAGYDYDYDLAGRIEQIDSLLDGITTYAHDDRGQLTDADHTSITDEAYSYDDNGNRTMGGYTVGANNRILSDGTYDYEYDDEGNQTAKETIATGERVEYTWDHRNRLTTITFKDALGGVTKTVEQSYDVFNQWVRSQVDSNGPAVGGTSERFFLYDDGQIVLEFDGGLASDLSHRYLWGDAVDQLFADETVTSLSSAGDVIWPVSDHLGTPRDLLTYDAGSGTTTNANHRNYNSYGILVSETNGTVTILIGFTGRPHDKNIGLNNHLHRWYDPLTGTWKSLDPIGFAAADANLRRYVGNNAVHFADPSGLETGDNTANAQGRVMHAALQGHFESQGKQFQREVDITRHLPKGQAIGRYDLRNGAKKIEIGPASPTGVVHKLQQIESLSGTNKSVILYEQLCDIPSKGEERRAVELTVTNLRQLVKEVKSGKLNSPAAIYERAAKLSSKSYSVEVTEDALAHAGSAYYRGKQHQLETQPKTSTGGLKASGGKVLRGIQILDSIETVRDGVDAMNNPNCPHDTYYFKDSHGEYYYQTLESSFFYSGTDAVYVNGDKAGERVPVMYPWAKMKVLWKSIFHRPSGREYLQPGRSDNPFYDYRNDRPMA